jgi:glycosyltransferase involved in cell wall biosynthesis
LILGGAQENTLLTCEDLISQWGDETLLVTGPSLGLEGSLIQRARAAKVPLVVIESLRRAIHPWRDWRSLRAIERELRAFAPDVVHTHSAKAGLLGRVAAARLRIPAIVHTVHGAPFHPYQPRLAREFFRRCERFAARRRHRLVSVADAMTDQLVAAGVAPREKFTTVYSGMEVEPFLAADQWRAGVRRELGYRDDDVVVGKVARLFRLKGHDDLIAAFARLAPRLPRLRLLLVGDGSLRPRLERLVNRNGLADRVRFLGLVGPERIPGLMGAIDLVVHTSLREGLARVLPQALLAGRPAVSYDVDGAREVVLPDVTGYLAPPRDVAAIERAIERLATDPSLRQRLGAEGRRRFAGQFRHETMTRRLRELYGQILADRTAAPAGPMRGSSQRL